MKIVLYGEHFLPAIGGVEVSLGLLARGLVELDVNGTSRDAVRNEVTLATRTAANGMDDSSLPYRVVRQPGFWHLFHLIRKAEILHIAGPCLLPLTIAWMLRKPTVVEHHGYQAVCPNGLLFKRPLQTLCRGHFAQGQYRECLRCCSSTTGFAGGFRALLLMFPRRWLCRNVAANIMITNHTGMRLNLPRSHTIYYGIPDVHPSGLGDTSSASNGLEIAYVGRLVAEKGLPVLLDAAKRLKAQGTNFKLSFIGSGPEQSRLEQLVKNLGLVDLVTFTGDLRGPALEQAVNKVEVVVMPSVWEETAGLSAIEQMMRGRVVVAADIGGLAEVVGAAGLKFTSGDSAALCSRLREVAKDRHQVERLGHAARQRAASEFGLERAVTAHHLLYKSLLRRTAGSDDMGRGV